MAFAIENHQTRESLKEAFEKLFCKYGREFKEDDEIDLLDMKIVKKGKHLAKIKPVGFGDAFRRPVANEEYRDIFAQPATERLLATSCANNLARRRMALDRPAKQRAHRPQFDQVLGRVIEDELEQEKADVGWLQSRLCKCRNRGCFECRLVDIISTL